MKHLVEKCGSPPESEGRAREARWGGSKAEMFRHGNHPSRDRVAISLPS
jgi:hypothetical protein